jgi:N-glycosidase YbiA
MSTINFYSTRDAYGEFSNFAPFSIKLDGLRWPTSEHYFQAQKFVGKPACEVIRTTKSAMQAAQLARRTPGLRSDWDYVRDDIMRRALYAKFTQHEALRALLLGTKNAKLVEHTVNDSYWGDGGDGSGKNRLGVLLMELREQLLKAAHQTEEQKNE